MKTKYILSTLLVGTVMGLSSCADKLELAPIDFYGSTSYWKKAAQAQGYIDGLHSNMRSAEWTHNILFGELRGGQYKIGTTADGSSTDNGSIALQNFDSERPGVSKFGNYFGYIANCNLAIARIEAADYLSDADKKYFLGIAYGLRAFYFFDLYRIYGGVPLRLGTEVIDGEIRPSELYLPRAKASEVMAQIKKDLNKSLENFGNMNAFDYGKRQNRKSYWSKAATECLMGEVYLWNAKVSIGDNKANIADLATAKTHLENVANNYSLSLQPKFADVFDATPSKKGNSEIVFAIRYTEGEATNPYRSYVYNIGTGQLSNNVYLEDGTLFVDPLQMSGAGGIQRYEYKEALFNKFDKKDSRRLSTFLPTYKKADNGTLNYWGTVVRKNIGIINSAGLRVFAGDVPYYRLAWVYLTLAEIANMQDDKAGVEKYVNAVRKRAYGDNWGDEFKFVAGDFTKNELAILAEKDKEFVQEGQRWWDLCRMTYTKGGKHLVFVKEGSVEGTSPVLEESEAYKLLWPVDKGTLDNDDALEQTPGYGK